MSPRRRALRDFLRACDVSPRELARDPTGASWLPESLRAWALADPDAQEEIRRFVAAECCLFEAGGGGEDPAFVAEVARRVRAAGPTDRRANLRTTVILTAHLAAVVCLLFVASWAVPGFAGAAVAAADDAAAEMARWAEAVWAAGGAATMGWLAVGLALLVVGAVAVARRGRFAHTSRA